MKKIIIKWINPISDIVISEKVIRTVKRVSVYLALIFFFGFLILDYLQQSGWVDFVWPEKIPKDYFFSVYIAFTFILFYEVLAMIFALPKSVADSIGKQYEIMSLIILRSVFEHVGTYRIFLEKLAGESVLNQEWGTLQELLAGTIGSLILFFLIRIYYTQQRHTKFVEDPNDYQGFVVIKKGLSLILIVIFLFLAFSELAHIYNISIGGEYRDISISHIFFKNMFSVMIFIDLLLVLLTTRYTSNYYVVFRTSGLALSTVILRMSFSSSQLISVLLAILAVLIGIGVTFVYNQFQLETARQRNIKK